MFGFRMQKILAVTLIALLPSLASCSSDDDSEEEQEWPIKELYDGRKVVIKEVASYPDSIYIFNLNGVKLVVPCEPIDKSMLPSWVLPRAAEITGETGMRTTISMGYNNEDGRRMFILHFILEGWLGGLYDEDGTFLSGVDEHLLEYSSGWKCILIVRAYELN